MVYAKVMQVIGGEVVAIMRCETSRQAASRASKYKRDQINFNTIDITEAEFEQLKSQGIKEYLEKPGEYKGPGLPNPLLYAPTWDQEVQSLRARLLDSIDPSEVAKCKDLVKAEEEKDEGAEGIECRDGTDWDAAPILTIMCPGDVFRISDKVFGVVVEDALYRIDATLVHQ